MNEAADPYVFSLFSSHLFLSVNCISENHAWDP